MPLFLVFFCLISCGSPDPRNFNDELMVSLNSADKEYNTFYSLMEEISKNDNFTSIYPKAKEGIKQLEKQVEKINHLKVPKEGQALKSTCIDYITIMITSIKGFLTDGKLSESQFDKAVKIVKDNEEKLNSINEKIIETQRIFAEKNKFDLKETPQK